MPAEISVGIDERGRPVAIKQGFDAATRDRIAQEATRLAFAQQPGVVELAGVDEAHGQLSTLWAPGGSLESSTPDLATAARILATVAAALADLHDRGIIHGRIQPGHVLLGSNSEAWLTGFAEASLDGATDRLVDLRDLAALIDYVLARHRPGPRTVPPRPGSPGRRPSTESGRLVADLQMIAERARQPEGEPQCSMREVARLLRETAETSKGTGAPPPVLKRPSRRVVGIMAIGAVVGLTGSLALARGRSSSATAAPVPAPTAVAEEPAASTSSVSTTTSTAAEPQCADPNKREMVDGVDVDGDGCQDAVSIDHGLVTVGEARYRLSTEPNDQVLVADWDCDGTATPAILRTRLGSIEVFDNWATATQPATARPVIIDPSVVLLQSSGGRCPELSATRTDGTSEPVAVTP